MIYYATTECHTLSRASIRRAKDQPPHKGCRTTWCCEGCMRYDIMDTGPAQGPAYKGTRRGANKVHVNVNDVNARRGCHRQRVPMSDAPNAWEYRKVGFHRVSPESTGEGIWENRFRKLLLSVACWPRKLPCIALHETLGNPTETALCH